MKLNDRVVHIKRAFSDIDYRCKLTAQKVKKHMRRIGTEKKSLFRQGAKIDKLRQHIICTGKQAALATRESAGAWLAKIGQLKKPVKGTVANARDRMATAVYHTATGVKKMAKKIKNTAKKKRVLGKVGKHNRTAKAHMVSAASTQQKQRTTSAKNKTEAVKTQRLAGQKLQSTQPAASQKKAVEKAVAANQPLINLCTIAGSQYLLKVISLYRSLESVSQHFHLYICCIDNKAYRVLRKLQFKRCTLFRLDDIENDEIKPVRHNRGINELCWTLKSYFMMYLLKFKTLPSVIYCDADLFFFSDPVRIIEDWADQSVYLCKQRDLDWVEDKYGKYQAGLIGFKNNDTGLRALEWWKNKCLKWCYYYEDTKNNRWGDQKYLDALPSLFGSVRVSDDLGINAAPWNTIYNNHYKVSRPNESVTINETPLVVFHFACIDIFNTVEYDLWNLSPIEISNATMHNIYIPYLRSLRQSAELVRRRIGQAVSSFFSVKSFSEAKTPYKLTQYSETFSKYDTLYTFCTISSRSYIAKTLALYRSIEKYVVSFHIWICCMDLQTYNILKNFRMPNATLLHVSDVETTELKRTKFSKQLNEYCWSLKPVLCTHILSRYNVKKIIYCDSDIYFFSSPKPIYDIWSGHSTFINHQFGSSKLMKKHGVYQAGMIGFTNDPLSLKALNWWRKRCIEWCYDNHKDTNKWGDQKYLEKFPYLFSSLKVNDHYGTIAAPWNIVMNNTHGYALKKREDGLYVGDERLVCYHFGSIVIYNENEFDIWKQEPQQFNNQILDLVYTPYLLHIRSILREIDAKGYNMAAIYSKTSIKDSKNYFRLPS